MTLPEVCPLDKESGCKKEACHLYHIDWRSGDENCTIGYRYTHREGKSSQSVQDNYAENVRMKLGKTIDESPEIRDPREEENRNQGSDLNTEEEKKGNPKTKNKSDSSQITEVEEIDERVVTSDKNTTVIQSYNSDETIGSGAENNNSKKSGKNIDKAMDLDLPDDYEKEFWK